MADFLRGLRLLIVSSFRASPRTALFGLSLEPLGYIVATFSALYVKEVVDGVVANDTAAILESAVGFALTMFVGSVLRSVGWPLRTKLLEETGTWLESRVLEMHSSMPGLEHTERPEYFDRLQSINGGSFAGSIMFVVGAAASLGRITIGVGLMAAIHPALAMLPLFGIPSVLLGVKAEKMASGRWVEVQPQYRRADSFYQSSISAGPAKELRVFRLEDEVRRRHREERNRATDSQHETALIATAWTVLGWLSFAAGYVGALGLVAVRARNGDATVGDLVLAITVSSQMNDSVAGLAQSIQG